METGSFETVPLAELIPGNLRKKLEHRLVIESGFGAGPGFIATKRWSYDPPTLLCTALIDLEKYRRIMRRCHVKFDDESVLTLDCNQFLSFRPPRKSSAASSSTRTSKGVLKMSFEFSDMTEWDKTLAWSIDRFKEDKRINPNLMSANMETYAEIDMIARKRRDAVTNEKGKHPKANDKFSLSSFSYGDAVLEFTLNEMTPYLGFILIYDVDPSFDGEPVQIPGGVLAVSRYGVA